ncbi:hypothetical protein C8Q72DRAFT_948765, partial [Fomitopsis betulina]
MDRFIHMPDGDKVRQEYSHSLCPVVRPASMVHWINACVSRPTCCAMSRVSCNDGMCHRLAFKCSPGAYHTRCCEERVTGDDRQVELSPQEAEIIYHHLLSLLQIQQGDRASRSKAHLVWDLASHRVIHIQSKDSHVPILFCDLEVDVQAVVHEESLGRLNSVLRRLLRSAEDVEFSSLDSEATSMKSRLSELLKRVNTLPQLQLQRVLPLTRFPPSPLSMGPLSCSESADQPVETELSSFHEQRKHR